MHCEQSACSHWNGGQPPPGLTFVRPSICRKGSSFSAFDRHLHWCFSSSIFSWKCLLILHLVFFSSWESLSRDFFNAKPFSVIFFTCSSLLIGCEQVNINMFHKSVSWPAPVLYQPAEADLRKLWRGEEKWNCGWARNLLGWVGIKGDKKPDPFVRGRS